MVAKSYQGLEIVGDVYTVGSRTYVRVRMMNGMLKQVRWYSAAEYENYYGEIPAGAESMTEKTQKELFGFAEGYITIFKGETFPHKEYFKMYGAKYNPIWNWYFESGMALPELPEGISAVRLDWAAVSENDALLPEESLRAAVANLIYEPDGSEYVGEIGERLDMYVTFTGYIDRDSFGIYKFTDEDGNKFTWCTGSIKNWVEGEVYHIRGTVKEHAEFRGSKQTKLSRCMEVKS